MTHEIKQFLKIIYHKIPYTWRIPSIYSKSLSIGENINGIAEIKKWQLHKFKELISYAFEYVPGYNQLYNEAGVKPGDIQTLEDINNLPFTEKKVIRDNIRDFTSRFYSENELSRVSTSGSSGIPFAFKILNDENFIESAFVAKKWSQFGWNIHQSGIVLRGSYDVNNTSIYKKCDNTNFYAHNDSYLVTPSYLSQSNYSLYRELLLQHSAISYIFGYPSSIYNLSSLIENNGDCGMFNIRSIFLSAENIFTWQIEVMKRAFPHAQIMALYGQTERVIQASWWGNSQLYHVDPFYGYTEVLNSFGRQVEVNHIGELVGTSFWSKVTPFIRYKTSDLAILGDSSCSANPKSYMVLKRIDGRINEVVIDDKGNQISLTAISDIQDETFSNVEKFRIIQNEPGVLNLKLVSSERMSEDEKQLIMKRISKKLGTNFLFSVEQVESISESKSSGKYSYLEQNLQIEKELRLKL